MQTAELNKLDRALVSLVQDGPSAEAIDAVAMAWIELDAREQACKLHYFRVEKPLGWHLRAALWAASGRYDLGELQSIRDELGGRPWP